MKFEDLLKINVSDHIEKKKTGATELSYLSWVYAWSEFKKAFPHANYTIWKDENGLPYVCDEDTGYMCYVTVDNGEGEVHEMWLPVMDGANKAMKSKAYTYSTRYGEKSVEQASMFDVNKTLMRALVKCIAMFGLGLYIFAGEDLPESTAPATISHEKVEIAVTTIRNKKTTLDNVCKAYGVKSLSELNEEQYQNLMARLSNTPDKGADE